MKISLVMPYYERLALLRNTLHSVSLYNRPGLEVIIVDDGSAREPLAAGSLSGFSLDIKILAIKPADKKHKNPCAALNVGIKSATGDIVIIQNAEAMHGGNLIGHVVDNLSTKDYFSYACYSLDKVSTDALPGVLGGDLRALIAKDAAVGFDGDLGWYNHSVHRPVAYHFASAMSRENMEKLGGFDMRYSGGLGYDDDEFIARVRRLGLNVRIIDDIPVFHQWHYSTPPAEGAEELRQYNMGLFRRVTLRERGVRPGGWTLPFLNYVLRQKLKKLLYGTILTK